MCKDAVLLTGWPFVEVVDFSMFQIVIVYLARIEVRWLALVLYFCCLLMR